MRACALHDDVTSAFRSVSRSTREYPEWFAEGKTRLIPKPGEFTSENHRLITCLNTLYKWFTSYVLGSMDEHLEAYDLMENQLRGAKARCSGTTDNLMIDRMVTLDRHRHKRNLSVAWIDVRKAYHSVDHGWLKKIMLVHRFPMWICKVVRKLCDSWKNRITATIKEGSETSLLIYFNRGLPQGDALYPRLFTLCLSPVARRLSSTEGYRLSKPIVSKIPHLLYIDDLKVFAASEAKLNRVLKMAKVMMGDVGLQWNPKKCNVLHVRSGVQLWNPEGCMVGQTTIDCLKEDSHYRFLGAPEQILQEEKLALKSAANTYLTRLSVIWSSPLSDSSRIITSKYLALPVLSYLMWSQHWNFSDLRNIDRKARKIICDNGGKHPLDQLPLYTCQEPWEVVDGI